MKITFPHMGSVYIGAKAIFEDLGKEVIVPPRCSKKTLDIGTKHSPESMCLPLKINIGNYIEAIEKGADTIILTDSYGPCRFGLYSVVEKEILNDLGYNVDFVVLGKEPKGFINNLMKLTGSKNLVKITKSVLKGYKVIKKADELISYSNKKRAVATNSFDVDKIMENYYNFINKNYGIEGLLNLIEDTFTRLHNVEEDKNKDCLKVGIIGEIYTVIEPYVNVEVEKRLGHLGVKVDRFLTPTKWVEHNLGTGIFGFSEESKASKEAKPYLSTSIGGHAVETIGSAIMYSKEDYDGIIQIYPFGCMPEIVAQSILPTVSKDYNIPILTLVVDEMTGEAGYQTRIEAFVDLIRRRKEQKSNEGLLSRS